MRKCFYLALVVLSVFSSLQGQYLKIGDASFLGSVGGPLVSSTGLTNYYSRYAYIFPQSVLGNLKHGDTITSIEFSREAGSGLNNSCNLKIIMQNTKLTDYGSGSLLWSSRSGGTVIYDQNPAAEIGTTEGFQRIPCYNKVFVYDTTKGFNLEILVEYSQSATQSQRINWYFENGSTVSGYSSNQTKYFTGNVLNDTLKSSADYHPTIIFNYPRYDNDIAMVKLYTLGKLPIPLGNPDSVQALVRNVGKKSQSNVKVHTWSKGYNKQIDSSIFSINLGEQKFIQLPSLNPTKKGLDTIFARISNDQNTINDTAFSFRLGNENIYSYRDVTQPPAPGGIGFNGLTGDFVARFFSNKAKSINQVTVEFALTGRAFKVGIWASKPNGAGPGKLLYISDSLTTTAGKYILNLKKSVSVNGVFFVGVRQLNGNNVAFGYQIEDIVRPSTFYYTSPAGDTNWFDFHPDAPFKFLIEPRLQGDTDLTAISADYPKDTLDRLSFTTLAPKGTISNIGARDLMDSFDVTCEITFFGKSVYKKVIRDTMSSGQKRTYTFPNTFDTKDYGEHELRIFTSHPSDQIVDNDTAIRKFYVGVKNDLMISAVYEPSNGSVYEYLIDTIQPVATILNTGYNSVSNVTVRCRIWKGTTVVYNKTQVVSLPKFNSKILIWPTYKCTDTGKLRVIFTSEMVNDAYRQNDTQTRLIQVYKSYDVGVDSVALPDKNKFYVAGVAFRPIMRVYNDGVLDAGNVLGVCSITSKYTSYTYADTMTFAVEDKGQYLAQFPKSFKPDKNGIYTMSVRVFHSGDNVHWNDSFRIQFNVGYPYDYQPKQIISPLAADTLSVGGGPYSVKARIRNNGFIKNTDVVPVICQIWKNNIRIYQDIKSLNLDTSAQFDLEFSKNFFPLNAGQHRIVLFTNYVSDVNRKNDTVTGTFWVKVGRDAFVLSIDTPASSGYEARVSQIPLSATITNVGNLKMSQIRIYADIFRNGKLLYSDKTDDSLNAGESKSVNFSKTFIAPDSGFYRLLVYTYAPNDQNIYNDTTEMYFYVGKIKDAKIMAWIEPQPGSVFVQNTTSIVPGVILVQAGMDTVASLSGKVYFTIEQIPGSLVYSDSTSFAGLKNNAAINVVAPTSWAASTTGTYQARAIVVAGDLFPENDTLYSSFQIQTNAVHNPATQNIRIYPNPSNERIQVVSATPVTTICAVSVSGAIVPLRHLEGNTWEVSGLSPGVYVLQMESSNGRISTRFVRN